MKGIPLLITTFFTLIIVMNLIFWYVAEKTFPGSVTSDSYGKGLQYDKVIAEEKIQKNHNINGEISYKYLNNNLFLTFKSNAKCQRVIANMMRTVHDQEDIIINLEHDNDQHSALLADNMLGLWFVRIKCLADKENLYYFASKLNIKKTSYE